MDTPIEDFISRVARWRPEFPHRIRGATPKEVETLTDVLGFALPEVHEQFLLRMGHEDGGARFAAKHAMGTPSTHINHIIDLYRLKQKEKPLCMPEDEPDEPPRAVLLEAGGFEIDTYVQARPEGGTCVVRAVSASHAFMLSDSLTSYLARRAFLAFKHSPLPHRLFYSSTDRFGFAAVGQAPLLGDVRGLCASLGFVEEWFSERFAFGGEWRGVVILAEQTERSSLHDLQGLRLMLSSPDLRLAQEVGNALSSQLKLIYGGTADSLMSSMRW